MFEILVHPIFEGRMAQVALQCILVALKVRWVEVTFLSVSLLVDPKSPRAHIALFGILVVFREHKKSVFKAY